MLRLLRLVCAGLLLCVTAAVSAATEPKLVDLDGRTVTLEQYKGRKVLLNIWATWCVPCLKEMPEIDAFAKSVDNKRVVVLGVAADEPAEVKAYVKKLGVTYPIAIGDPDQVFAWSESLGNVTAGLPYSVVLDGAGKVVWKKTGGNLTAVELRKVLAQ